MENEEMLSNDERSALLTQVFTPKRVTESKTVDVVQQPLVPSNKEQLESFGSLLEKTLQKRNVMDKEENATVNEDRKHAIDESRKDLIGDMVKVFFR